MCKTANDFLLKSTILIAGKQNRKTKKCAPLLVQRTSLQTLQHTNRQLTKSQIKGLR